MINLSGQLFENLVASETLEHRFNHGLGANLSFYRDARGLECDLLYESGREISLIEVKVGATVATDWMSALHRISELLPNVNERIVLSGGSERQSRSNYDVLPLSDLGTALSRIDAGG